MNILAPVNSVVQASTMKAEQMVKDSGRGPASKVALVSAPCSVFSFHSPETRLSERRRESIRARLREAPSLPLLEEEIDHEGDDDNDGEDDDGVNEDDGW